MKTRNPAFTVESRRGVRKKRLEENTECDQTLCQSKCSTSGKGSMSHFFFFFSQKWNNILVTECCWLNYVITTDLCLLNMLINTFMNSLILLSVQCTSYIGMFKMTGEISCLCTCISLLLLLNSRALNLNLECLDMSNAFIRRTLRRNHLPGYSSPWFDHWAIYIV